MALMFEQFWCVNCFLSVSRLCTEWLWLYNERGECVCMFQLYCHLLLIHTVDRRWALHGSGTGQIDLSFIEHATSSGLSSGVKGDASFFFPHSSSLHPLFHTLPPSILLYYRILSFLSLLCTLLNLGHFAASSHHSCQASDLHHGTFIHCSEICFSI